jgi:hypothetical protein
VLGNGLSDECVRKRCSLGDLLLVVCLVGELPIWPLSNGGDL